MKKKNRFCVVDSKRNKTANHDRSQTRTLFVWLLTAGNREREREGDCFFEASLVIYTVFQGNGVFSDDGNVEFQCVFWSAQLIKQAEKRKSWNKVMAADAKRRPRLPIIIWHQRMDKRHIDSFPEWCLPIHLLNVSFTAFFSSHNINKSFRNGTGYINIWPVEAEARLRMHAESYAASPTD